MITKTKSQHNIFIGIKGQGVINYDDDVRSDSGNKKQTASCS
jgi:hypothetical protein